MTNQHDDRADARTSKPVALYHEMRRGDGFEKTAGMLWCIVHHAAREYPGVPRRLLMDIEGHRRTGAGNEYDDDATELIAFVRAALGQYLTETPWGRTDESTPQSDELPEALIMTADRGDDWMCILTGDKDQPVKYDRAPAGQA
jgi:hypothetical protein